MPLENQSAYFRAHCVANKATTILFFKSLIKLLN
jgi:hypothetical protein